MQKNENEVQNFYNSKLLYDFYVFSVFVLSEVYALIAFK